MMMVMKKKGILDEFGTVFMYLGLFNFTSDDEKQDLRFPSSSSSFAQCHKKKRFFLSNANFLGVKSNKNQPSDAMLSIRIIINRIQPGKPFTASSLAVSIFASNSNSN
jgi:hypothetical protein